MSNLYKVYYLPLLILVVLLTTKGEVLAAVIDMQNETVIISNTQSEARAGKGQAASSSVISHTSNGSTTIHIRTEVNGVAHEFTTTNRDTTAPASGQRAAEVTPITPTAPANPVVHQPPASVLTAPDTQADSEAGAATAAVSRTTSSATPDDTQWWVQIQTYFTTVVAQYFINLWQPI